MTQLLSLHLKPILYRIVDGPFNRLDSSRYEAVSQQPAKAGIIP